MLPLPALIIFIISVTVGTIESVLITTGSDTRTELRAGMPTLLKLETVASSLSFTYT